jgi:5'-AMP-activated protein kinase regulatory beta subunit
MGQSLTGSRSSPTTVRGSVGGESPSVETNAPYGAPLQTGALSNRPITPTIAVESSSIDEKIYPVVFRWDGAGHDVSVSGSFNNWQTKVPLHSSQGDLSTIIELPEGSHEYKFFVNGAWMHDPNEATVPDNFGGMNNIIVVKPSDFDLLEALDGDMALTVGLRTSKLSSSPPGRYGQEMPDTSVRASTPPVLPPQLMQAILNAEPESKQDPSLLAEPNHVMLNHLYALSVRDGVMVLGATHRYKQKYVTTMLYKPIN